MIATYLNKYFDGTYTYYDLVFEENEEQLLRLGGVSFRGDHTIEEMESRVVEIVGFNLPDYEINQIII